jgi:hypothetical protein
MLDQTLQLLGSLFEVEVGRQERTAKCSPLGTSHFGALYAICATQEDLHCKIKKAMGTVQMMNLHVVRTFWAAVMAKKVDHQGLMSLVLRVMALLLAVISVCINLTPMAIPVR